jgi:hypothetical protein
MIFFGFLPWSHCGCRFTQGSLDGVLATMVDLGRVKLNPVLVRLGFFRGIFGFEFSVFLIKRTTYWNHWFEV